ncbi:hypothetical protein C2E23DRAFT_726010, partial [Lenzites betulinus]
LQDWEAHTTAVTLTYHHGPDGATLPGARTTAPILRNLSSVNDTAAPSVLASLINQGAAACACGCVDRPPSAQDTAAAAHQVPLPRLTTVISSRRAAPVPQPVIQSSQTAPPIPCTKTVAQAIRSAAPIPAPEVKTEKTSSDAHDASPAPKRKKKFHPEHGSHKIRGTKKWTCWYGPTQTRRPLAAPPLFLSPTRTAVYVHLHDQGAQMWMFAGPRRSRLSGLFVPGASFAQAQAQEEGWQLVHPGYEHPDLEGYVLHLRNNNTPNWVKADSMKSYVSGRRKRLRMGAISESRAGVRVGANGNRGSRGRVRAACMCDSTRAVRGRCDFCCSP